MSASKKKNKLNFLEELAHIRTRTVWFRAKDGFHLVGTLYRPESAIKGSVLLSSGTGIPRSFYANFAASLAKRGYGVLTYDFRGIGESRPGSIVGFEATKRDWGRWDMSAAFARLVEEWPEVPHMVFGHSVGGQLIGLMERPEEIDAVVTYGSGFGYWGNIKGAYRYFVAGLWYVGIPLMTKLFRYMPAKQLQLGEDLPSGVATDWARWGKRADYFTVELGEHPGFQQLSCPWMAFLAEDDEIATLDNAHPLYEMYPNAGVEVVVLRPSDFSAESLGHLRFFSRINRDVWHVIPDWLDKIERRTVTPPPAPSFDDTYALQRPTKAVPLQASDLS